MTAWRCAICWGALLLTGCVLADPAQEFPFAPTLIAPDAEVEREVDVPVAEPPLLMFTEILFQTNNEEIGDVGEFIEIRNVGDGPADPRNIVLFLTSFSDFSVSRIRVEEPFLPEEFEVYDSLQPIEPSDYFIFVRHEHVTSMPVTEDLADGSYYDYGRFSNGPSLPHAGFSDYQLDLGYRGDDGRSVIYDTVRWTGASFQAGDTSATPLRFQAGASVEVRPGVQSPDDNDDPAQWCISTTVRGNGHATPGAPSMCDDDPVQ